MFDSFWWWIPYKHNNISWTHSNTSEIPYVWTILHGESHQNYRRIPMKSPWHHGVSPTDATLGRSNCSDQVGVDPTVLIWISIGANATCRKSNENGSWRSWKGITFQTFFRFWSVSICFDLLIWKVMRFWWLMLISPVDLFPSCIPIVGQSLLISAAIKVIWWLSHPFEEYDNMLVIGDQHPISVIVFEEIQQFWSDPIWPTLAHGPWQSLSKGRSSTAMW